MEVVTVSNLKKSFSGKTVLNDMSFQIPKGQVVALLGRNGSGKTTLMRILYGLISPESGQTQINGILSQVDPVALRLKTCFMTEDCHLYSWMDGRMLEYFVKPFYPTWDSDFFHHLVKVLEIPLETRVKEMSRGSKRKLMLALTLAPKPEVLLLDEPLAGLDAVVREQIITTIIQTLADEEVTILVSSHEILEIEKICDRVLIISAGDIILDFDREALKSAVKRVVVTLESAIEILPSHPNIISCKSRGAELELITKNYSEEQTQSLLKNLKFKDWRAEGLSLQEIFVQMTSGKEE